MTHFLLLHGFLGQPEQWQSLEAELRQRGHTSRALSLPGGTWDAEIDFVHTEVTGAPTRPVLVGHALGGALVRSYATVRPDTAFGLATVAAPPPHWGPPVLRGHEPEGAPGGSEPRLAILAEDDALVPYAEQQRAAALLCAPTASVPGGHSPHVLYPALVATLLANWLSPEGG